MSDDFDAEYWSAHWRNAGPSSAPPANPHLADIAALPPGRALDAGCGEGAEAIWLAARGWAVTAVDISADALARAARRSADAGVEIEWAQADLSVWRPAVTYDLLTTFYAHPTIPQLEFYARLADWVAPGGTLLVVGHGGAHGHGHHPASVVTAEATADALTAAGLTVEVAREENRMLTDRSGRPVPLRDVVVRAARPA